MNTLSIPHRAGSRNGNVPREAAAAIVEEFHQRG